MVGSRRGNLLIVEHGRGRMLIAEFSGGRVVQHLRRHIFGESVEGLGSKIVLPMVGSGRLRYQLTLSFIGLGFGVEGEAVRSALTPHKAAHPTWELGWRVQPQVQRRGGVFTEWVQGGGSAD